MKNIKIKIGSQAWIMLYGYDKDARFPFSELPQMQVYNDGDEVDVNLNEERVDELISALQEIKKTFKDKK